MGLLSVASFSGPVPLLPTTNVVRGKAIFSQAYVNLFWGVHGLGMVQVLHGLGSGHRSGGQAMHGPRGSCTPARWNRDGRLWSVLPRNVNGRLSMTGVLGAVRLLRSRRRTFLLYFFLNSCMQRSKPYQKCKLEASFVYTEQKRYYFLVRKILLAVRIEQQ